MMNPTSNKKDFDELSTALKDMAYSYIEKYSPSKQQLKVYLMKKVLITGAAGFIGASLTKKLILNGDQVIGIDNLCPYYDVALKKHRLKEIDELSSKNSNWYFRNIIYFCNNMDWNAKCTKCF